MTKIFTTENNLEGAKTLSSFIGLEVELCEKLEFGNEFLFQMRSRDKEAIIYHELWPDFEKSFFELLSIIDALENCDVDKIDLVVPYVPYLRQDRSLEEGASIGAKVLASILLNTKVQNIYSLECHSGNAVLYFKDRLKSVSASDYFIKEISNIPLDDSIIISPDFGSRSRAAKLSEKTGVNYFSLTKVRDAKGIRIENAGKIGKFNSIIIIDDIIDTGATIIELIKKLEQKTDNFIICVSHVLNESSKDKILKNPKVKFFVNPTITQQIEIIAPSLLPK